MEEEEYSEETRQSCFDMMVAYVISSILDDEEVDPDKETRAFVASEVLSVLEEHLDEEGQEYMQNAFEKIEHFYNLQIKTDEIIQSFDWNKKK